MEKGPSVGKAADGDRCGAANPVSKAAQTYSTGTAGPHITRYPMWLLLVWGSGWGGGWERTEGLRCAGPPTSFLALHCCNGEGGRGTPAPLYSHHHVTETQKAGRWGLRSFRQNPSEQIRSQVTRAAVPREGTQCWPAWVKLTSFCSLLFQQAGTPQALDAMNRTPGQSKPSAPWAALAPASPHTRAPPALPLTQQLFFGHLLCSEERGCATSPCSPTFIGIHLSQQLTTTSTS